MKIDRSILHAPKAQIGWQILKNESPQSHKGCNWNYFATILLLAPSS